MSAGNSLRLIVHGPLGNAIEDLEATAESYRRTAAESAPEIRQRWLDGAERYEGYAAAVRGGVEVLRDLAAEARDFSTQADYKVSQDVEEAFVEALDTAERLLGGQS